MKIEVSGLGKSFNNHRIFRNLNYTFESGDSCSILGPNGSGKSTLLKILSGFMLPTSGRLSFENESVEIDPENWFRYLVISAPYMELPEELTLIEFLQFHYQFKGLPEGTTYREILIGCGLKGKENVQIRNFSSGMKQRIKLAVCLHSRQEIVLLDEPAVNLDEDGLKWYRDTVRVILPKKITIIASNTAAEHDFCQKSINLSSFK